MKIILVKKTKHYCFTVKIYDEQLLNTDSLHFFHKLKLHIDPTYILITELFN